MMVKTILSLVILLGLLTVAGAQDKSASSIDSYLSDYLKKTGAPGFSVVVIKDGLVLLLKGYGVEKVGSSKPMTPQTVSAVGSLTKSFTSLAILQLAEKGLVDLDTPVITYLPWFRLADKKKSDKITCRMLMSMRSGIPSVDKWMDYSTTTDAAIEDGVRGLSNIQLSHEPGTAFEYSNEGYNILGVVISTVTNMPFRQYMAQNVLAKLDMKRSSLDLDVLKSLGLLGGHQTLIEGFAPAQRLPSTELMPAGSTFGSTAEDLGHYLTTILGGGVYKGQALLSPESFAEWFRPQISFPGLSPDEGGTGADITYASGWMQTDVGDRRIIYHGGNAGVMTSITAIDRARGVAVSILFNFYSFFDPYRFVRSDSLANNILRLANGEKLSDWGVPRIKDINLSESWIKLSEAQMAAIEGEYRSETGTHAKVTRGKTGLELSYQTPSYTFNARLEFINPQRGVGIGMEESRPFSMMLNPDNSVRYVTMKGVRLFPKTQVIPKGYSFINVTKPKLKLLFPEAWEPVVTKTGIEAGNVMNRIQVFWQPGTVTSPEQALLSNEIPQERGSVIVEGISGRTYTQQAFRLANGRRLLIVLTPRKTGVVVIKFYSQDKDASNAQRLILGPLLKYSQWQPNEGVGE